MLVEFVWVALVSCCELAVAQQSQTPASQGSIHLPLVRREVRRPRNEKRSGGGSAEIGLGDYLDVTYNVLVQIGGVETPLVLDTGSADLWVISDECTGNCTASVPLYRQSTFVPAGQSVQLLYGDSRTGTHATGPIGRDTAGIAGLTTHDQYLAAITDTNTTVLETGSAGILGLGFPPISVIWRQLVQAQLNNKPPSMLRRDRVPIAPPSVNFRRPQFPSFDFLLADHPHVKRQNSTLLSSDEVIESFATYGPLLARLVDQHVIASPMFVTTLQRDTLDIGGNMGLLSIGALPAGISTESLTWVPIRGYNAQEGGLPPSPGAPNEVYPLVWEIALDDVYFDGVKLERSILSSPSITLSALVDTGNSLIRGPQDVIAQIHSFLGGQEFDCDKPHNLSFQIGGKLFPVDARDFIHQSYADSVERCAANIAVTDPPGDGFLYSWSLGDPFLKAALVAFHYGNLTRPSHDPPRIGLLSTVPANDGELLREAISAAEKSLDNFPATSDPAPSGTYSATATGVGGVPQATENPSGTMGSTTPSNGAARVTASSGLSWISCGVAFGVLSSLKFIL